MILIKAKYFIPGLMLFLLFWLATGVQAKTVIKPPISDPFIICQYAKVYNGQAPYRWATMDNCNRGVLDASLNMQELAGIQPTAMAQPSQPTKIAEFDNAPVNTWRPSLHHRSNHPPRPQPVLVKTSNDNALAAPTVGLPNLSVFFVFVLFLMAAYLLLRKRQ